MKTSLLPASRERGRQGDGEYCELIRKVISSGVERLLKIKRV